MNGQHGKRVQVGVRKLAVIAFALAWAGAAAPAWSAAQGLAAGARSPGGWDASGIGAAADAGSWGQAIEVPGLAALTKSRYAEVTSVSCASAGNCAAGGYYTDLSRHSQGFVALERHGHWRRAIEVPRLRALNTGGYAEVLSVSCAAAGHCAAGGFYSGRHHHLQGFVAVERPGGWGRAMEVPRLAALNTGGYAEVLSLSCAAVGNCAAVGFYSSYIDHSYNFQGFVAVHRHGRWSRASKVPGLAALNTGGDARVTSVSCASAGSCAAGGYYWDGRQIGHGFVVSELNGSWSQAVEVPGLRALGKYAAAVASVSCGSPGNCATVGSYTDGDNHGQGFVAVEQNGVWGQAIEMPGLGALNTGGDAEVLSVSCGSAGNCAAGGSYTGRHRRGQGFVAVEQNGVWGQAINVPGLGVLNAGGDAEVSSVSCGLAGNCAAGGSYTDGQKRGQGFVAVEERGVWGRAIRVPGLEALNKGGGVLVTGVSCAPVGGCAAGGSYTDRQHHAQGFVASQTG